jgi:hypothetical protein
VTLSSAPDDQLYDLVTIDAGPVGMLASPDTSQAWRGTVRTSAWTGTRPLPAAALALGPNLEHRPVAGADKAAGDRLGRRDPAVVMKKSSG